MGNITEIITQLTCVKICHVKIAVLMDWRGTRLKKLVMIPGLTPVSTHMTYLIAAMVIIKNTARITTVVTSSQIFSGHLVHVNSAPLT